MFFYTWASIEIGSEEALMSGEAQVVLRSDPCLYTCVCVCVCVCVRVCYINNIYIICTQGSDPYLYMRYINNIYIICTQG